MRASPATRAARTRRQIHDVTPQRRASHPAVTSLADSIATAMPTTATGAPGNSTTMPRIENHAAAPARAMAAVYAARATTRPVERATGATGGATGSFAGATGDATGSLASATAAGRFALPLARNFRDRSVPAAPLRVPAAAPPGP